LPSLPFQKVARRAFLRDVVVIVLKDELNITPIETDPVVDASSHLLLTHASYSADRRYVLTGHSDCQLLARDQDLWFTDCDTHAASSGGPVFIQKGQNLKLAAIMVGIASEGASIAVPAATWIDVAANPVCP
jgi:V8-like Glu-specific endopeptidase